MAMAGNKFANEEPRIWALRDRSVISQQTKLARGMRRMPTEAEKKLWRNLRRLALNGSHFRRQVRLGRYIVDFASHSARLVIEIDGGQHCENAADAARTKFIESQGYRVLRFWNNDVLSNIEGVLEVIQSVITTTPTFNASPQPRGNRMRHDASSPSPLVGEGRGGGSRSEARPRITPRPPPPTPPHKGEGRRTSDGSRQDGRVALDPSPQGGGE
jgi:very-short-patch-repair endonuclease